MKLNRILLTLVLSIFVSTGVLASSQDITITIDGVKLNTNAPAQVVNGRTLVPMRAIFEALGAKIDWDNATRTAIGTRGNDVVKLQISNTKASINGKEVTLDTPATIVNGSTLVPVRFIAESLGSDVNWDGKTRTVVIGNEGKSKIDNNSDNNSIVYTDSKYFEFDKTKGEIIKYSQNGPNNVVIPKMIDGVTVKKIGYTAFTDRYGDNNYIESVVFPDTITEINDYAFQKNRLTELHLPKSLTRIGEAAFSENDLKVLTIPDNVEAIGLWAFWGNTNLTLVSMPPNVRIDRPENPKDWNLVYDNKVKIVIR